MELELVHFQVLAAALFSLGVYGVLARKSAVMVLMAVELMLSSAAKGASYALSDLGQFYLNGGHGLAPDAEQSSSNASGAPSNMRRSTCAPMKAYRPPAKALADTSVSTTSGDRTHLWTGRRPIRHTSPRQDQSRSRHNRAENPPGKRLETVQLNRTTSMIICMKPHKTGFKIMT